MTPATTAPTPVDGQDGGDDAGAALRRWRDRPARRVVLQEFSLTWCPNHWMLLLFLPSHLALAALARMAFAVDT